MTHRHNGRWSLLEIVMIGAVTLLPYHGDAPSILGSTTAQLGLIVIASMAMLFVWASGQKGHPARPASSHLPLKVFAYAGILGLSTLAVGVSGARIQLFAIFVFGCAAFFTLERVRPGSFVDVIYRAGVLQLLIALIFPHAGAAVWGTRMDGAMTPVTLGFVAAAVAVIAYGRLNKSETKWKIVPLLVVTVSLYVVVATFSRAAILSVALAAVLVIVFQAKKHRKAVGVVAIAAVIFVYATSLDLIIEALGGADSGIESGTGRYNIWATLIANNQHWFLGHGFATMRYGDSGPDDYLLLLTGGLPSENALLQAILMGGIIAGVAWLVIFASAMKSLWSVGSTSRGVSLALGSALVVNALYSVGQSGISFHFLWLLAAFSFAASNQRNGAILEPCHSLTHSGRGQTKH